MQMNKAFCFLRCTSRLTQAKSVEKKSMVQDKFHIRKYPGEAADKVRRETLKGTRQL
jgi:hypothetical protein